MSSPPVVELVDITHRYGATTALDGCRLAVGPGEVHGLVGENGSGKSTVVKLLSGIMRPTQGAVRVDGQEMQLRSPAHAQAHGVLTVFQETLIADECVGLDNVFGGTDGLFRRRRRQATELATATEVVERLGAPASILTASPYRLSLAERQILTLVRALVRPWRLLILDEATSALDLATRDRLFALVDEHRAAGRSVLFVSHRMDELEILVDRATVQRSGRTVGTVERAQATTARLLSMMDGRSEADHDEHQAAARRSVGIAPATRCREVALTGAAAPFDLEIFRGEILGVGGLDGQGGATLVETLAGIRQPAAGSVEVRRGEGWSALRSYRKAVRSKVAYVPGKRQDEGLFPTLDVRDNLAMATLGRHARGGVFTARSVLQAVREQMSRLHVVPDDPSYPITGLSGGNAQKVLVGRWLAANPDVLVLNDPLRGVDLGTKRDFYGLLRELTEGGMTVVMLSTEIEELLTACDRVAVCRNHTLERVLEGDEMTYDAVLAAMFGHRADAPDRTGAST
ncbi:sugar ABC transporter ATP-binding protein [Nonomuraea polychroma]|uniref:sugar ABC transporter ATP-binding protein n=1 Tax=Nonomuraea polychroma TaxID=46176 RepID=UPI003D92320B